ncbi:MAG: YcgL domain-containing protein [Gammaproteobacteria bacterium]|nr:MAG: YcgL domain-containing protein [Gammaproteobacteria bacterium]
MSKLLCNIYRSTKKEGMYLYVDKREDLERIPESLLQRFGKPELAMTIALSPERKLARAEVGKVLEAIAEQGFYLQMPPSPEQYLQEMRNKNDKL